MAHARDQHGGTVRRQMARVVARLRAAPHDPGDEDVENALALVPASRMVAMVAARWMIMGNRADDARTLLARALRCRPDHPGLLLERARCLRARGESHRAMVIARRLTLTRPAHARTLVEAACIAIECGCLEEARRWACLAARRRMRNANVRAELLGLLMRLDLHAEAKLVIEAAPHRMPIHEARLMLVEHRVRDAIDLLTACIATTSGEERDAARSLLIEALHRAGEDQQVETHLAATRDDEPQVCVAGAMACAAAGHLNRAIGLLETSLDAPGHGSLARMRMAAIALAQDRPALLGSILARRSREMDERDRHVLVHTWRAAAIGKLVSHDLGGLTSSVDPAISVLDGLVRRAYHTLSETVEGTISTGDAPMGASRQRFSVLANTCREWLTGAASTAACSARPATAAASRDLTPRG